MPLPQTKPAPSEAPIAATPKTFTNWDALNVARLKLVVLTCARYRGGQLPEPSCHTRLPHSVGTIKAHIAAEHGGTFRLAVRQSDAKSSKLWSELAEAGLESHDFRCDVCDAVVRLHPSAILPHLKPHKGKTRMSYSEMTRNNPSATGMFGVTFASGRAEQTLEDEDESLD